MVTLEDVKGIPKVKVYIEKSDRYLEGIGYTKHGFSHSNIVARNAYRVLKELGYPERRAQLASIAGYLHDIGNLLGRKDHSVAGAMIAKEVLEEAGMPDDEIADVITAISTHENEEGIITSEIEAALIIADKVDVHRSRVRNKEDIAFDIHDRVNYAVTESILEIGSENKDITLKLEVDTNISQVMEYFEIFLSRMVMCRRAATFLGRTFHLIINKVKLL